MGNWYCKNCKSWEDSVAENQSYKPDQTVQRDITCRRCDKTELIYTDSQKARYKELVKERTDIPGYIEEVERFSTWWNNNFATVVAYYDGYYRVFLLVYDPVYSTYEPAKFPVDNDCNYWGEKSRGKHNSLSDAKGEAEWLVRYKLNSWKGKYKENPILLIHPYGDSSHSFDTFVKEPYVVEKYSTSYLKPFDIVKTYTTKFGFDFYHAGVYLGKIDEEFKVCQFTRKKNDTTIDKWSNFLEGSVISYHPVIPFKNYKDISREIVWAKDNDFRKNNYDLLNRNCEHFANMIVYGINYSEQIERERGRITAVANTRNRVIANASFALAPFTGGLSLIPGALSLYSNTMRYSEQNNNKTSFCLRDEIRDVRNDVLSRKSDWESEKYENRYLYEVPPKQDCRIM